MTRKEEPDLKRAAMLKDARARARTYFSILADEFLNDYLPAIEDEFNRAQSAREDFELDSEDIDIALATFVNLRARRKALEAGK